MAENKEEKRGVRKTRKGVVVSRGGAKTVVVRVERRYPHPLYGKVMRESKNYHVHDESDKAQVGDKVVIEECRPLSRLKRWRVVEAEAIAANVG